MVLRMSRSSGVFVFICVLIAITFAVSTQAAPIDAFRQPRAVHGAAPELTATAASAIEISSDPNERGDSGSAVSPSLPFDPNDPNEPAPKLPSLDQPQAVPEPLTLALLGLGLLMLGFIGRKLAG
jgi:hypothetical protein